MTYRDTAPCAGLRARAAYDADGVVVAASVSSGRGNAAFAGGAARDAREARNGSERAMRAIASGSTARDMTRARSNARAVGVGVRRTRPERRGESARSTAIDNLRANGGLQVRSAREPKVIFVRLSFVRGWAERIVGTRVLLKLGREIRLVVIGAD